MAKQRNFVRDATTTDGACCAARLVARAARRLRAAVCTPSNQDFGWSPFAGRVTGTGPIIIIGFASSAEAVWIFLTIYRMLQVHINIWQESPGFWYPRFFGGEMVMVKKAEGRRRNNSV